MNEMYMGPKNKSSFMKLRPFVTFYQTTTGSCSFRTNGFVIRIS